MTEQDDLDKAPGGATHVAMTPHLYDSTLWSQLSTSSEVSAVPCLSDIHSNVEGLWSQDQVQLIKDSGVSFICSQIHAMVIRHCLLYVVHSNHKDEQRALWSGKDFETCFTYITNTLTDPDHTEIRGRNVQRMAATLAAGEGATHRFSLSEMDMGMLVSVSEMVYGLAPVVSYNKEGRCDLHCSVLLNYIENLRLDARRRKLYAIEDIPQLFGIPYDRIVLGT